MTPGAVGTLVARMRDAQGGVPRRSEKILLKSYESYVQYGGSLHMCNMNIGLHV